MAAANTWLFSPLLVKVTAKTPAGAAMLHTTIAPTMLKGSPKENVLPQDATAWINYRIAPGDTSAMVLARAKAAVGKLPVTLAWNAPPNEPTPVSSTSSWGWKVLAGAEGEPMCAPIPASRYHADGASLDQAGLLIFLTEVEVGVKLGRTLAEKGTPYTPEEAAAAIVSLHPALEMCASSFDAGAEASHLLKMGDLQSNAAVIVGAALPAPAGLDLANLDIALAYDGAPVAGTAVGASWQQIVEAIAWLANHAISRGLSLNEGDVIITGARVKHPATGPMEVEARLAGMAPVTLTLT